MDLNKANFSLTMWGVLFVMYFIILPIGYITNPAEPIDALDVLIFIFTPLPLMMFIIELFNLAEPYEIERIKRFSKITLNLLSYPMGLVVAIIGGIMMHIGSGSSVEVTLKIITMSFGFLFVVLGLRWYSEDVRGIKLPKSEELTR